MSSLVLHTQWLERFSAFNKLIVGFSGGLDSTVLLHLLAAHPTLKKRIKAIHVNHGISPHAKAWQAHCAKWCGSRDIPFVAESVLFNKTANVEEEARCARFKVFSRFIKANDCLILGHHQADQAETVLLQLFRGAGITGLAAMTDLNHYGQGMLARPLLHESREQLEHYAKLNQLTWIDDESNLDSKYSRNFIRHEVLPLLKEKWPNVAGNLARTAAHCQEAKVNLDALAILDNEALHDSKSTLAIAPLKNLSRARMSNVLRVWLAQHQVRPPSTATFARFIDELISASPDAMPEVCWGRWALRRHQGHLVLFDVALEQDVLPSDYKLSQYEWANFPAPLPLHEAFLLAREAHEGLVLPENAHIVVRYRQGGEAFQYHGQTKKLKKLFQEWHVPTWLRDMVPLVYVNDDLAAVVGYAVSDLFYSNKAPCAWEMIYHASTIPNTST